MSQVAVVTDSTSYLPPGVAEQHGVVVVPLYVVFGGDRTVPETRGPDYRAFVDHPRPAGARGPRLRPFLRRAAPCRDAADPLAALCRRLPLGPRAAARRRPRDRL